jgi:hypothetical protein
MTIAGIFQYLLNMWDHPRGETASMGVAAVVEVFVVVSNRL